MIDIRTVCTHDARRVAEMLARLLEAEEHQVHLSVGRQSLRELEQARTARDAVLIIWSPDAPSQTYMQEWARQIDPSRLVEIALAPGWPRIERKAPVMDFSTWRGERGGRAWTALNERLRAVTRVLEPAKPPPKHAALALGLASVAAVGIAAVVRVNDTPTAAPEPQMEAAAENVEHEIAMGGALYALEPPSAEDFDPLPPLALARPHLVEITPSHLVVSDTAELPEVREEPTLLERLAEGARALNPLRGDADNDASED